MKLRQLFFVCLFLIVGVNNGFSQDTTSTSQGTYFLEFVKKVYFNPTILLETQDFREATNVRALVLPDLNGAEENQITGFERGMQKIIRFLIEGDDEGAVRLYFDAQDSISPFSFVCSEEIWCKFSDADKDSIERRLNAPFQGVNYTLNSSVLFDNAIRSGLDYAKICLQRTSAECAERPDYATIEINTKPLSISLHNTSGSRFDLDNKAHDQLASWYAKATDVHTQQDWYAPAKFLVSGTGTVEPIVLAVDRHESLFKKENFQIKTIYNNAVLAVKPGSTNDSLRIELPADLPIGNPVEIVVKYTSPVDSIQYTVGFFMVYVYEPQAVVVNVLSASPAPMAEAELTGIRNELKKIYDPLGVSFTVQTKSWLPDSEWSQQIMIESSGLLSNYPPDLRDWVNGVQDLPDYDDEQYYLVLGLSSGELAGYMPRARNIGFIFSESENTGKTCAHELGHGVFHLRHIFSDEELGPDGYKQTENVMDYVPSPKDVYLHQWQFISDPAFVSWFGGDDEDGAAYILDDSKIPNYFRNADKTVSFLTPTLKIIRLPQNVTHFATTFGLGENSTHPLLPSGTLKWFKTDDGTKYMIKIANGQFMGYFPVGGGLEYTHYIASSDQLAEKQQGIYQYFNILGMEYVKLKGLTCGMYTGEDEALPGLNNASDWAIKGCKESDSRSLLVVPWSRVGRSFDDQSPNSSHFIEYFKTMDNGQFGKQAVLLTKAIEYSGQYTDLMSYVTNNKNVNKWKYNSSTSVNLAGASNAVSAVFGAANNPVGIFLDSYAEQPDGPSSCFAGYFDYKVDYHNWDETMSQEELLMEYIKAYQEVVSKYQEIYSGVINDILYALSPTTTVDKSTDHIVLSGAQAGQKTYTKMKLRNALNAMSMQQLSEITPRMRANLIALLLDQGETPDIYELEIVDLFQTCLSKKDAVTFLMLIDKYERPNGKHILGEMLDKIDDRTCFIGSDNFTALSRAICGLFNNMYIEENYEPQYKYFYTDHIRPFVEEYQKYDDVKKIKSAYITYNYSSAVYRFFKSFDQYNIFGSELISVVSFNDTYGKVFYKNNLVNGFWIVENGAENGKHFHPYDPIIFDDGGKVFSPYGYDANNLHPYPALILYFAEKKAVSTSATALIQLGVDLITFIIPGGAAFKIVGLIDKTCAAASIVSSMTQYSAPEFSQALGLTSGLLGLTSINPSDFVALGRNLDNVDNYRAAINSSLEGMADNMKPIDNYNAEVLKTCNNIDNATNLNDASRAYLKEFMKKEKKLAQVEARFETVTRINATLTKLGSPIEASTGLVKMDELLGAGLGITKEGDTYKLLGKSLGKSEGGKLKLNLEYVKSDFSKLDVDAELVTVLENVEYKKGWMGSTSGTTHQGDVLIFKKNQNVFCLDGVNCFTANTLIQTANAAKIIQDITVNDSVITFNEQTAQTSVNKVTNVFQRTVKHLQRLVIGNDTIFTTPEHPFYHKGRWLNATALVAGMVLQSPFGADTVFANTAIDDTTATVYNFTVENSHTYVVGSEHILVHNMCERIEGMINSLPDDATKKAFTNALRSNKDLAKEFVDGAVRLDDWKFITAARGLNSSLATDIATLKKVGKLRKNTTFMNAVGGDQGLSDVLKANVRARCTSCGTAGASHMKLMDEYLDDVEHFVINFESTDGFSLVLDELKKMNASGSANYAMEGAAFMIDYVKRTPQISKNSVSKFDGKFDLDPDMMDVCTNCRFDIELGSSYGGIKYEFKSYGSVAINKIGTPGGAAFTNQFKAYLADATDITKIQYIFDATKFSDVNAIKNRFKMILQSAPESIFNSNPALFTKIDKIGGGKIEDWEDLAELINSPNLSFDHQLFSFIQLR